MATSSRLSRAPTDLQPEGIDFDLIDSFEGIFEPIRYKGFFGGRGSAKSHTVAGALIVIAGSNRKLILCCREIQNSIRDSVKQLLEDKIDNLGLRQRFYSTREEIICDNGSRFIFKGLRGNTDAIKSLEGIDIAWVEEAQSCSAQSLEDLKNTIRRPGSELWFTWNPKRRGDPIDVLLRSSYIEPDPDIIRRYSQWALVKRVFFWDNPYFPDTLKAEMTTDCRRDPGKYRHIWLGEYLTHSDAQVFHNWRIGSRHEFDGWSIGNPAADVLKHAERYYFGADFGFSPSDPTVLIRAFICENKRENRRELYIDGECVNYKLEIDQIPSTWKAKIPGCERWPVVADSSRPETISYLRRNGFPKIEGARKGYHSVEDGIEFLKSYDIIVHPDCKHTIDELTLYSWKVDPRTDEVLPVLEDKKNHVIDSLRYALEATRVIRCFTVAVRGGV